MLRKSKFVPVHAIKVYRERRSRIPLIFNLSPRQGWVVNVIFFLLYPLERTLLPIDYEDEGDQQSIRTFWRREKFLAPPRFEPQTVHSVVKLLYRLCHPEKTKCVILHAARTFGWRSGITALPVSHGMRWLWSSVFHPGDFTSKERDPGIHSVVSWVGVSHYGCLKKRKISCWCQKLNHDSFGIQPVV